MPIPCYFCDELYSIGEDGFCTSLCELFGRHQDYLRKFSSLRDYSYPQTLNIKVDSLAQSVRKQTFYVVYMNVELPFWFTDSL